MVALRSRGNWRWEGPLGTPLGLVHWKRASSAVEAGTSGFVSISDSDRIMTLCFFLLISEPTPELAAL